MTVLHSKLLEDSTIQRQIERETESIHQGVLDYREMVRKTTDRGEAAGLVPVQRIMAHWFKPFKKAIQLEQRRCYDPAHQSHKDGQETGRALYGPAIRLLKSEYIAAIGMGNVMRDLLLNPEGVKFSRIAYEIGRDILAEANLQLLRKDHRGTSSELRKIMQYMPAVDRMEFKRENQTKFEQLTKMCARLNTRRVNWWAKKTLEDPVWSKKVCVAMGGAVAWHLQMTASCVDYDGENFVQAIRHETRREGKKSFGYLVLTDECYDLIDEGHQRRERLRPKYVPMIAPPVRWEQDRGGYYVTKTPLVARTCHERAELMRQNEDEMKSFYAGVDALNRVPLHINRFVLDIQKRMYRSGGGIANLPLLENPPIPKYGGDEDDEQKLKIRRARGEIHRQVRSLRGQRAMVGMLHNLADDLVDHEAIYQVHQADFRGRCYPVQTVLNHQSSDLARSLYRFARPVKVKESGRRWMCATMAELWGIKGLSFNESVDAVQSSMAEIESWAHDPEANDGWTRRHDGRPNKKKAFQALAMAHALSDDEAAAHIPIQQDGTCNGMQHYAAMGRDEEGAKATNLTPAGPDDRPHSVYLNVAEAMRPMIERDAAKGDTLAALILDRVTLDHQCAKQVVMPAVYGMTAVGARQAMYEHLDEADIDGDTRYKVAMYLGKKILNDALREVCSSTVETMDWLKGMAAQIARAGHPVRWTTPLGFPVIQTYRKTQRCSIVTLQQKVVLQVEDSSLPVKVGRQVDGFAPNFVHSIDATHMLLAAIGCDKKGIDLVEVHDAFWTHAQQGDKLGETLRRSFVALHQHPLLEGLHAELQRRHMDLKLPKPPASGSLWIEEIEDAFYLFS